MYACIGKPELARLCHPFFKDAAKQPVDWDFVHRCWDDPHRELQYAALEYLKKMQQHLTPQQSRSGIYARQKPTPRKFKTSGIHARPTRLFRLPIMPFVPSTPNRIRKNPMPAEIRVTYSRLKMFVMSLVLLAIAAAASPLLFVGSLKAVLSGVFIVLFCLVFAALLLYRAADSRAKLVLNADGIRIVQAFAEEELDGSDAESGGKIKRENVFYPWERVNGVVFVYPFPAKLCLSDRSLREIEAILEAELKADRPLPDDLEQLEAYFAQQRQLSDSLNLRQFTIALPVIPLRHGKHLPDLIRTLAAEPDKSRRQAVLNGFCQTFFPKTVRAQAVAQPAPREFPVRLPAHPLSIRRIGGGYPLANILCALIVMGSLGFAAVIVRNAPNPADIREFLPLLPVAAIAATACWWQLSRYRSRRAVLAAINRPEAYPWKLVAIPIYVAYTNEKVGRTHYFYTAPINGKMRKIKLTDANFQLVRHHGQYLAFAPRNGGAPVPIDADLRNIRGLNPNESRELLRQIKELAAEWR